MILRTNTSDAQIHYINNYSLCMSFVKLILYFDIYTQMALQASFTGVLFVLYKLWIINLLLDPLPYTWVGAYNFCLPCHLVMSEAMFFNSVDFSLEQNISRLFRQAFIHYCELHQVWEQPIITAIIYVTSTLWVHALNSEHAQNVLCIFADAHLMDLFGHDHYFVCVHGFEKSIF